MRARLLAGLALALAACNGGSLVEDDLGAAISRAEPGEVLRLGPGVYLGPFVIDKPITLIGGEDVIVRGTDQAPVISIVETTGVLIRDLVVDGGSSGIEVRGSEEVELDGIRVTRARWHGFHVEDSEVSITDCQVGSLRASLPQGVEIVNSDSRPPSMVSGCRIEGPVFEGLAAHVSHVTFRDNIVTGAWARAVMITEMSDGVIEGNQVTDSTGSAYFCGDMSKCSIVDNTANGVGPGDGRVSQLGHGVVVHGYSSAYVSDLHADGLAGQDILPMIGGYLLAEPPPYP